MKRGQASLSRTEERGAALIVSLVLLLIMTIIGISAMNGARLEVSMAGMMQREEVALRGAERALTAAERYVESSVGAFDDTVSGHYLPNQEDPSVTDWSGFSSLGESDVAGLSSRDAFVVEYEGLVTLPGGAMNDGGDVIFGDKVNVYRVTTRSDTDGKAVRIIESIYTKFYNPLEP